MPRGRRRLLSHFDICTMTSTSTSDDDDSPTSVPTTAAPQPAPTALPRPAPSAVPLPAPSSAPLIPPTSAPTPVPTKSDQVSLAVSIDMDGVDYNNVTAADYAAIKVGIAAMIDGVEASNIDGLAW